jgi:hypothetical protein
MLGQDLLVSQRRDISPYLETELVVFFPMVLPQEGNAMVFNKGFGVVVRK